MDWPMASVSSAVAPVAARNKFMALVLSSVTCPIFFTTADTVVTAAAFLARSVRYWPNPSISSAASSAASPKSSISSSAASAACSISFKESADWRSRFKSCSALAISRCISRNCCVVISPRSNCACICAPTWRRLSTLVSVSRIASDKICCRCANSSVFSGSNFNNRSTCFSSFCKFRLWLLIWFNAVVNFCVSPANSIVIPFK